MRKRTRPRCWCGQTPQSPCLSGAEFPPTVVAKALCRTVVELALLHNLRLAPRVASPSLAIGCCIAAGPRVLCASPSPCLDGLRTAQKAVDSQRRSVGKFGAFLPKAGAADLHRANISPDTLPTPCIVVRSDMPQRVRRASEIEPGRCERRHSAARHGTARPPRRLCVRSVGRNARHAQRGRMPRVAA